MYHFAYNIFNCSAFLLPNFVCLQDTEDPYTIIEETPSIRRAHVSVRVDDMFAQIKKKLPGAPRFLLCLLSERKNNEVYGWFMFLVVIICYPSV